MTFLEKQTKFEIFKKIKASEFFNTILKSGNIMSFLESIWELRLLASTDSRFKDLKSDIHKHIIDNDDYDLDTLFIDKLDLFGDDDKFKKFIEQILNPKYYDSEIEITNMANNIETFLNRENYNLIKYGKDSNGYHLYNIASNNNLIDFPKNDISFFVDKSPSGHTNKFESHEQPNQYPAFVLVFNHTWNDFNIKSYFDLFYYVNKDIGHYIGAVKIIHQTEFCSAEINNDCYEIGQYISDKFEILSDEFCSLGQTQTYYDNIKKLFPEAYRSILWALKDCSVFSQIEEHYRNHKQFHSLIREDKAEQILREEKYIIEGQNIESKYQFSYKFIPEYAQGDFVDIEFEFDNNTVLANRLYAVIGKNGVGKTQFITTLPMDIANKEGSKFNSYIPIFSKIIAVSNSYYDHFKIPKKTVSFNYVYCGLSKMEGDQKVILPHKDMQESLVNACKQIEKHNRIKSLKNILENILEKDTIEQFFLEESNEEDNIAFLNDEKKLSFQYNNIPSICNIISSGQNVLMYIFCNIIANIRYDSLILFDEPETHLHPNATSTLMTAIYKLIEDYKSYCIVSTHSPLIIREVLGRNVYVMEREDNYPSIRKIGLDSFGENLTVLTEEIFGNKEVAKYYQEKIRYLINQECSYERIVELLKTGNIPLSLNTTLFIKNIIESENAKSKKI